MKNLFLLLLVYAGISRILAQEAEDSRLTLHLQGGLSLPQGDYRAASTFAGGATQGASAGLTAHWRLGKHLSAGIGGNAWLHGANADSLAHTLLHANVNNDTVRVSVGSYRMLAFTAGLQANLPIVKVLNLYARVHAGYLMAQSPEIEQTVITSIAPPAVAHTGISRKGGFAWNPAVGLALHATDAVSVSVGADVIASKVNFGFVQETVETEVPVTISAINLSIGLIIKL